MGIKLYTKADGSQVYYYRFRYNNKIHKGTTSTDNERQALKFEARAKAAAEQALADAPKGKVLTIEKAFETYISSMAGSGELVNITTRVNKMQGHKMCTRTKKPLVIFGFDPKRYFHSLTDADVQTLVLERRKEGASNGTILTELSTLSLTIKLTKKLGFECPDINFAEIKKDSRVRPHKGKLRFLTLEEETRFLAALHPEGAHHRSPSEIEKAQRRDAYDLALLLLDHGARYAEFAQLKWSQVDLISKQIHLYRTKTSNESILTMSDRVAVALQKRFDAPHDVFVFEAKDGTARKYAPKVFKSAFARAGIEGVSIHTMRHTFSSTFVQGGGTLQELQQILGHATASTSALYGHLLPNQASNKAAEIMNRRASQVAV